MIIRILLKLFTIAILFSNTHRCLAAIELKPVPVTGKIQWVYSYAEGQKLALESGKPLLVVFRCER